MPVSMRLFVFAGIWLSLASAAPTVRLIANVPSPQPVGTVIGLAALTKEDGDPLKVLDHLTFRYEVAEDGSEFRVIRDFSRDTTFAWRPELYEHEARVRVTVRNGETKQSGEAELLFRVVPRVQGNQALATPTANPLVALFSAPACPQGSRFRVAFAREGNAAQDHTAWQPCNAGRTTNLYVAGMRADSAYRMFSEVLTTGQTQRGQSVTFHTGIVDGRFAAAQVVIPDSEKLASEERLLVYAVEDPNQRLAATDMEGNLVWYLPLHEMSLTRMLDGGRFLTLGGSENEQTNSRYQVISELDLAGNTLRETNIRRVAEQLEQHGIQSVCRPNGQQCVCGFHHDAIRLGNGHTIVIGSLERMLPKGGQGSKDPIDVLGVLIFDLDADLQLKWFWNAFDHLDVNRAAIRDEKCRGTTGGGGCPPVFLAPEANDWLHGNALSYSRADGNLLLSLPEQDWVIKIDYRDGKGTGKIIWKLGREGDFQAKSTDPHPWFSYEHDSGFEPGGSDTLVVLDNGQLRRKEDPKANTRGQLWKIDEASRTATLLLNADLGIYSPWVGSAQRLSNGNFHFTTGAVIQDTAFSARSSEVTPSGKVIYALQLNGGILYRSNRVKDLYTPPQR